MAFLEQYCHAVRIQMFHHRQEGHNAEEVFVKWKLGFFVQIEREELDAILCCRLPGHGELVHRKFFLERSMREKVGKRSTPHVKHTASSQLGGHYTIDSSRPPTPPKPTH